MEFTNREPTKGLLTIDAVVYAARDRLLPIMMTMFAITLEALPLTLCQSMMHVARQGIGTC